MWWDLATLVAGPGVPWARVLLSPLDILGAGAVACVTYVLIAPVWQFADIAVTRWVILLYRKVLARPINLVWLRR
jgi:undecaprenyl-diphosphatase